MSTYMRTCLEEILHVLAKQNRFAALSWTSDEHQVRTVYVLRVDILEGEHEMLQKAAVSPVLKDRPLKGLGGRQLCRLAQPRGQVTVYMSLLAYGIRL